MRAVLTAVTVVVVELVETSHADAGFVGQGNARDNGHARHRFEDSVIRQQANQQTERQLVGDLLVHNEMQARVDGAGVEAILEDEAVTLCDTDTRTGRVGKAGCRQSQQEQKNGKSDELVHGGLRRLWVLLSEATSSLTLHIIT